VGTAVVIAFEFVAITSLEFDTALLTSEVTRMHELTLNEKVGTNNRAVAHSTLMGFGADNTDLLLHTVGAVNVLCLRLNLVTLADEVGTTSDANEVLRVERETSLSIDDLATNNVVTHLTTLSVELHEVLLTIELIIGTNKEPATRERLRAVLTDEVIGVIILTKGLGNLTNNRLMANGTVRANRDIVAHNLRLLLLHEEVRIIIASGSG